MPDDRLQRQIAFAAEVDRLKLVERRTSVIGGARLENSAEHSWHVALLCRVFAEYAPEGADIQQATWMLLLHDVVEVDAGDTFAFDEAGYEDKEERERRAAERIFGLLPDDQRAEAMALWEEFEEGATPTARYANALDRFQGLLQNRGNGGGTWLEHGVARERVIERMRPIETAVPKLWPVVLATIDEVFSAPRPSRGPGSTVY